MKKHLSTIFFTLILLVGIGIFTYPTVSNYINSKHQSSAIAGYQEQIESLTQEDYTAFWDAAMAYNEALAQRGGGFQLTDEEMAEYLSLLDPIGTGMMGYLEIASLDVYLPIYHTVEESVLQIGVGHLPGSSLPTGTKSTHTVLSGHRGLPSSRLFTDLDELGEGDIFLLHIMNETFAYQVDQINIVLPEESGNLSLIPGGDYCTLITCTPYGVNTHRLLVRGKRVDYEKAMEWVVAADAVSVDPLTVMPFIAIPVIVILLIAVLFRKRR